MLPQKDRGTALLRGNGVQIAAQTVARYVQGKALRARASSGKLRCGLILAILVQVILQIPLFPVLSLITAPLSGHITPKPVKGLPESGLRGLDSVKGEWDFVYLAINLKRLCNLAG
jgi:hypothetical protein